jgi:hypothetical protein
MHALQFGEKNRLAIKSEPPGEDRHAEAGQHGWPPAPKLGPGGQRGTILTTRGMADLPTRPI